jgi:predicted MPP superfamily phosphohydrolase
VTIRTNAEMNGVTSGSVLERGSDVSATASREVGEIVAPDLLVDPRWGDVGDDTVSPKRKSLLSIAGNLLVEISLPKLLFAVTVLLVLPAVLLGIAPLVATAWFNKISRHLLQLTEIGAALTAIFLIALGTIGWRPLLRLAEVNFWSLNAMAVQPGYALWREALRHLAEGMLSPAATSAKRARVRAVSSAVAGIMACGFAVLIAVLVWPASRWIGTVTDLVTPHRLLVPTLANAIVLVFGYTAIATLIWGFADASMAQPLGLVTFDPAPSDGCRWRIAHLSDLHVVGERYGFRIESGRGGPRGNDQVERVMTRLEAIHRAQPLDVLLVCGDMTDAGLATEWAEFLDVLTRHPVLGSRVVVVPGNHDLNIVDRANPARLDLPLSIGKRLRQMRTLSAIVAVQGNRVRVVDPRSRQLAGTLSETLAPQRDSIAAFMETGGVRRAARLRGLFDDLFPMILPPETEEGLGIAILNSNAETHFSFTNALGLISFQESRRLAAAVSAYPQARWIIALHHHLIEYPMPGVEFSERLGTALVNGSWFIRKLAPFAVRTVVMHGHRHIDWIGACAGLKIVSAPSPVLEGPDDSPTHFYIHTLAPGPDGQLRLLAPERVDIGAAETGTAH